MTFTRISREVAFMRTAEVWSARSTCMRRNVGAVIVVGNNIVSIGYNGAPPGEPHCDGGLTCSSTGDGVCTRTTHAEANAIERLHKQYEQSPKVMYVTESPCPACAARMVAGPVRGFTDVYYLHEYRLVDGIKILLKGGIKVWRMTPSGFIMSKRLTYADTYAEPAVAEECTLKGPQCVTIEERNGRNP